MANLVRTAISALTRIPIGSGKLVFRNQANSANIVLMGV
jgi:hypothetical protein